MDPNRSTKKRKLRPTPSHPLIGVLTRSKSQILLHRQEPDRESSSSHDYSEHRVLINDLRTKRVFSPKPIVACSPNPKQNASTNEKLDVVVGVASENTMAGENGAAENLGVLMSCGGGRDREDINSVLSSIVKEYRVDEDSGVGLYDDGSEEVKQLDLGISCDIKNPGDGNHILSMADDSGRMKTAVATDTILNQQEQSEKKGEVDGDGGLRKGIDVLNQESVQTTPPDAEVFGDGKANEIEGKPQSEKKGEVDGDGGLLNGIDVLNQESVQTTPPDAEVFGDGEADENEGKPPNGILRGPDSCVGVAFSADNYKKNDSIPAAKPVLKPCFRRKLFKTPGSVSYKRLLPYLMNITTDRPYSPKSSQTPKPDKCFGQKQLQPKLDPEGQDASIHKSDTNSCSMERGAGVSGSWPTSVLISANESSSGNTADLTTSEHFTEPPKISDSQKVVDKLHEEVSVNGQIKKLELDEDGAKNSNPDLSSVLEDDAKGQRKNEGIGKSEFRFPSEGQEVDDVHPQSFWSTDECHSHRDFGVGKHSDDAEQTEAGGMTTVGGGYPCRAQNVNTTFSEAENSKSFNLEQRGDDDGKVQNQPDDSNEELVQMASPDAEIFAETDGKENGCGGAELVQKIKHHSLGTPLRGSNTKSATCASDRRKIRNSNNKKVLDPRSQLKLYKIPGSFSYRRLLPHLIDIAKDNSRASDNGHCYRFHAEGHTSNSRSLPMVALASAHDSSNDNERKLKSPQDDSEFAISLASCKEDWLPIEQLHSDKYSQLEGHPNQVSSVLRIGPTVASLCPPASCGTSSKEEGTILVTQVSVDTEADCTNSLVGHSTGAKPVEADSLSRNTTLQEAAAPTGNHSAGRNKGILKRNPRGCRGLCTCLNCASFRLHAERAFEFSRNQMQDTEEVTLDLIKELSYIRGMLEKAAHGVNNHLIAHANQVKEACRKASEAEELAKCRLGQMNYELNIHCRIPGVQPPRVSFANYVEEKVIQSQTFQEKSISSV